MDLSVYISELLGLQGEVNVPEVGCFKQIRVNGYYNEQEKKFYPPSHTISFEQQTSDDDGLAKYIAAKKNISLASSAYFISKYISGIKEQLSIQKVELAGLGYLQQNNSTLVFSPSTKSKDKDPSFFGFPAIEAFKTGHQPAVAHTPIVKEEVEVIEKAAIEQEILVEDKAEEIVTDKQVDIPTVITREERIEEQLEQEEYINDEPERKSYRNVWKVILLLVAIISLSLVAIYQYFPTAFDYFKGKQQTPIGGLSPAAKQAAKAAVKPDTAIKVSAANTAPTVLPTNVIDSTKSRFELMAGSFKTQKAADLAIRNYKSLDIVAKVVTDAPGKRIKISIGTFATEKEAVDARIELIKTKKVNRDIYPLEIKPKK